MFGEEIDRVFTEKSERVGETYTLRSVNDDWKIVVAMVHDAATPGSPAWIADWNHSFRCSPGPT